MEKIVIIGAGSAMFIREAIAEIITQRMHAEVVLVDVSAEALDISRRIARKMVTFKRAPVTIRATTNRRKALKEATAVICTIGVGGRAMWRADVELARKFGLYMPVGDTAGLAGSSRSLRMIPAMVQIAEDIGELCPDADMFNHGNPMATICHGVHRATGIVPIGLCHAVNDTARYLMEALRDEPHDDEDVRTTLKVSPSIFSATAAGINHFTWFTDVRVGGKNVMPLLDQIARRRMNGEHDPFSWYLSRLYNAYPAAGDRHVAEFFPAFWRKGGYFGKTLGVEAWPFEETVGWADGVVASIRDAALSRKRLTEDFFKLAPEESIRILAAMRRGEDITVSATMPNEACAQLPEGVALESPCLVTPGGLRPLPVNIPPHIAYMLMVRYKWIDRITLAALCTQKTMQRELIVQALMNDQTALDEDRAAVMANAMLELNAQFLRK